MHKLTGTRLDLIVTVGESFSVNEQRMPPAETVSALGVLQQENACDFEMRERMVNESCRTPSGQDLPAWVAQLFMLSECVTIY